MDKKSYLIHNKALLEKNRIDFLLLEKEVDILQSDFWFLFHDNIDQQGSDHRPCNNSEVWDLRLGKQSWACWTDFCSLMLEQKLYRVG